MKKRILIAALALFLLICQMPLATLSTAMENEEMPKTERADASPQDTALVLSDSIDLANDSVSHTEVGPKQVVRDGIFSFEQEIPLLAYSLTPEDLKALVQDVLYSEPMLFFLDSSYSYSISNGKVASLMPKYKMTPAEYEEAKAFCQVEMEKILEQSGAMEAEDDLMQALLLNDYIASHYQYDTTYSVYDMYGMLKQGKAVCQGYTLLYKALLAYCGIESGYAHSAAMNHIWSLVKIDGAYYHVDVTWADPVSDRYSLVSHNYFMRSDAYFQSTAPGREHYGWNASDGIVCDSTTYDTTVFNKASSPFVLCGEDYYYIDFSEGNLCRYVDPFTDGEMLTSVFDYWTVPGQSGSYYPGTYSGLAAVGANLYYNSSDSIGVYNVVTGKTRTILQLEDENAQIIGIVKSAQDTLSYAVAPGITEAIDSIEAYVIPALVPCDVNGDGILNIEDVTTILRYLAGVDENPLCHPDTNGDGICNVEDLNALLITLATAA